MDFQNNRSREASDNVVSTGLSGLSCLLQSRKTSPERAFMSRPTQGGNNTWQTYFPEVGAFGQIRGTPKSVFEGFKKHLLFCSSVDS